MNKLTEDQREQIKSSVHEWHNEVMNMAWLLDRIEQIVSDRLIIKPYHEHGNSVASDRTEQCESAKEFLSKTTASGVIERKGVGEYSMSFDIDKLASILTTYASQVCADKDARIKELEGLLSSDSVYGLFRFAYKSPESAQVYEISKKLRELKTK